MKLSRTQWALGGLLTGALLVRILGIHYGLPWILVGDEPAFLGGALKMIELKTLIPALHPEAFRPFYYPPFMAYVFLILLVPLLGVQYLVSGAANLGAFRDLIAMDPTLPWLAGRMVVAILGTLTVYYTYRIGAELFSRGAGIYAALLLATSFLHVLLSHFARNWVPGLFFVILAFFAAAKILHERASRWYWVGAGAAGLGFGVSYIPVIGIFAVAMAHMMRRPVQVKKRLQDPLLWKSMGLAVLLIALFLLLNVQEFFRILIGEDGTAGQPKDIAGFAATAFYHLQILQLYDPLLFVLGGIGSVFLLFHKPRIGALFFSYAVVFLAFLYFFFHSEVRYALLLYPLFLAGAAYLYFYMSGILPRLTPILFTALVLFPLAVVLRYDTLLSGDTRLHAREYIRTQYRGAGILTNFKEVRLPTSLDGLRMQALLDPASLRAYDRARMATEASPSPHAPRTLHLHFVHPEKIPRPIIAFAKEHAYSIVVLQYWQMEELRSWERELLNTSDLIWEIRGGEALGSVDVNGNALIPSWNIFLLERLGPVVEIRTLRL